MLKLPHSAGHLLKRRLIGTAQDANCLQDLQHLPSQQTIQWLRRVARRTQQLCQNLLPAVTGSSQVCLR